MFSHSRKRPISTAMLALSLTVASSTADILFHSWCTSIGIPVSPSVELITTPRSVAGRGVFAVQPLEEGDVIACIPPYCIFHPENAAECFPDVAEVIKRRREVRNTSRGSIGALWRRLFGQGQRQQHFEEDSSWQAELTMYALAAIEQEHPWSIWINQWQRDDPTHRLFESGAAKEDANALASTADELQAMMPELSHSKLQAALSLRLDRFEKHKHFFGLNDGPSTAAMYSTLCSRAIELDEDVVGVIPFYDMINHSLEPNLALSCDNKRFELFANRDIGDGEEIFLRYTKLDEEMDETNALWTLLQWGIPTPPSDIITTDEKSRNRLPENQL